jgi:thiol-disulfide isomerase/thioredoxin
MTMLWMMSLSFAGAPALVVDHWLPEAPTLDDRVLVVEVWATWCGPCRDSFPVLARLATEHPDTLSVVALTDEPKAVVERFVGAHPELGMDRLHIAVAPESTTQAFLFGGYEGRGIPSVYVIDDGEVRWSGSPEALAEHLLPLLTPSDEPTAPPPGAAGG